MTQEPPTNEPLVKRVTIRATPDQVFAFFVDAEKMQQWIGTEVHLDPRVGGVFRVVPNRVDVIRGEYLEVTPYSRVVFTWGFEGPGQVLGPGGSIVEVSLRPVEEGTEVVLVHRSLPDSMTDSHTKGWEHYLSRIESAAEGGRPGPDPYADPSVRHGRTADEN